MIHVKDVVVHYGLEMDGSILHKAESPALGKRSVPL